MPDCGREVILQAELTRRRWEKARKKPIDYQGEILQKRILAAKGRMHGDEEKKIMNKNNTHMKKTYTHNYCIGLLFYSSLYFGINMHIGIIGGGIAGLTAALFLQTRLTLTKPVIHILESTDRLGGRIYTRTVAKNGREYHFDVGANLIDFNEEQYLRWN